MLLGIVSFGRSSRQGRAGGTPMLMRMSSRLEARCHACRVLTAVPTSTDWPLGCHATDSKRLPSAGMDLWYVSPGESPSTVNTRSTPSSHATATLGASPEVIERLSQLKPQPAAAKLFCHYPEGHSQIGH